MRTSCVAILGGLSALAFVACSTDASPQPPANAQLISAFCGVDSCQNVASYLFTGHVSTEPDTSLVWGTSDEPSIEGRFAVTFSVGGDGSSPLSAPEERFWARYEEAGEETEWVWTPDDDCLRTNSAGEEAVDVLGAYGCAATALDGVGLDFLVVDAAEQHQASRVALASESWTYLEEAETREIHDLSQIDRYGPFTSWEYGNGEIEAGPGGDVRWVTMWSAGIQWTVVLAP